MKLALFFCISVVLHGVALLAPAGFARHGVEIPITLAVLPIADGGAPSAGPSRDTSGKSVPAPAAERRHEPIAERAPAAADLAAINPIPAPGDTLMTSVAATTNPNLAVLTGGVGGSGNGNGSGTGSGAAGTGRGSATGNNLGGGPASAVITPAQIREARPPAYPERARREGKKGRVLVRVTLDAQGKITSVAVEASSGHEILDRAATDAVKQWRFTPARAGDQPIERWLTLPIEFNLAHLNQ